MITQNLGNNTLLLAGELLQTMIIYQDKRPTLHYCELKAINLHPTSKSIFPGASRVQSPRETFIGLA